MKFYTRLLIFLHPYRFLLKFSLISLVLGTVIQKRSFFLQGFQLKNVFIQGREKTAQKELLDVFAPYYTQSLFSLSLAEIQKKIEQLVWIDRVSVIRKFPDTLIISLSERQPAGVWSYQNQHYLLDQEGECIQPISLEEKTCPYLLISGAQARKHFKQLREILHEFQNKIPVVKKAVFLRSHRWNLYLEGGIVLKLPEEDTIHKALMRFVRLWAYLKNKNFSIIDLRFADSVILAPSQGSIP